MAQRAAGGRRQEPKRLGRPPDVDSAATHARLMAAARRAFAADGFDATTNKRVAEAAGITTGAIYHYYASKTDLYVAVYEEVTLFVADAFEKAMVGEGSLVDRFSAVLDVAVELNRSDPSIAGFVVGVAGEAQRHPELRDRVAPIREARVSVTARLVADARAHGELADDLSDAALEDLLTAVLSGLARFSNLTADSERHARAVEALKRFFAGTMLVSTRRPAADDAKVDG